MTAARDGFFASYVRKFVPSRVTSMYPVVFGLGTLGFIPQAAGSFSNKIKEGSTVTCILFYSVSVDNLCMNVRKSGKGHDRFQRLYAVSPGVFPVPLKRQGFWTSSKPQGECYGRPTASNRCRVPRPAHQFPIVLSYASLKVVCGPHICFFAIVIIGNAITQVHDYCICVGRRFSYSPPRKNEHSYIQ